jgi:hypothetical protein
MNYLHRIYETWKLTWAISEWTGTATQQVDDWTIVKGEIPLPSGAWNLRNSVAADLTFAGLEGQNRINVT